MVLKPGDRLQDRYRVGTLLAEGGMGAVFRGYDTRLDVPVAIKEMTVQPGLDDVTLGQLRRQFQQEAKVLARLRHPNLVRVSDFFVQSPNAYLVMDFVEGESLADRIAREGALAEGQVVGWTQVLLEALAYCHDQGLIHRDIKPHNVIITSDGQPVLVDFGLVKLWDPGNPVTQTAVRGMGTLEYAPPEQYSARAGHTDPRTDIYSLGSTMYHALTGQAPPTATDRMADPAHFIPVRRLNPKVSQHVESIILRAMELPRDARFQSARAMLDALTSGALPADVSAPGRTPKATAILPEPGQLPPAQDSAALTQSETTTAAPRAARRLHPLSHRGQIGDSELGAERSPRSEPAETTRPKRARRWLWGFGVLLLLMAAAGVLWRLGYLPLSSMSAAEPEPKPTPVREPREDAADEMPMPENMIVVGTNADWPPMEFVSEQGDLAGYDIDLMRLIGERAGFGVEFRPVPWEDVLAGLEAGEFDAVISGLTITPERLERFRLSDPYLNAGVVVVVREDSEIGGPPELRGRVVGVMAGTRDELAVLEIGEVDIRLFDNTEVAVRSLVEGHLDAVACSFPVAARYVKAPGGAGPRLKIVGQPFTEELYGIAVARHNVELLERINAGLHAVQAEGLNRELEEKWLR